MVKVSIIIPVYNVSEYLKQCLDSVVNQTINETEIIIVNDGSTDNSEGICRKYAEKDSRITLIHQENAGLAAARQAGLEKATGEYIGFVDSDDWLEPTMYEEMYDKAVAHDADIVFCNVYKNEDKKEEVLFPSGYYDRKGMETVIFPRLLAHFDTSGHEDTIRWCNWLRLYRRKLIEDFDIRFDKRFRRCQDLPFTFECTIHAQSYYYMGERYLYHNRMNYESLSKGYTKNMWGLLKPLVLYLEEVVAGYSECDFSSQMRLRAALSAFECADNEVKPNNTKKRRERVRTIRQLMRDREAREFVRKMDTGGLSKIYKIYHFCFVMRLPALFYAVSYKRYSARIQDYKSKNSQVG